VCSGMPRSGGWVTTVDAFAHDTLHRKRGRGERYVGMVASANHPLARCAARPRVPVVNVWPSSPARHLLPGVFPDSTETRRIVAEHLLAAATDRREMSSEVHGPGFDLLYSCCLCRLFRPPAGRRSA